MGARPAGCFAATCLTVALAGATGRSQDRPPETSISGRVVDALSGAGIEGATVLATPRQSPTGKSVTGSTGQFRIVFPDAVTGMRLEASKTGYLVGYRGQLGPHDNLGAALRLDIARGEQLQNILIRLWPEGAIAGTVMDAQGVPVAGAMVDILTRIYTGAGPRWSRVITTTSRADNLGGYRVARLAPGSYVVAARAPSAQTADVRLSPPSYHPGARTAAAANLIVVDGNEQRADVTLEPGANVGPLSGRLTGAGGAIDSARVRLIPIDANGDASEYDEVFTTAAPDGRFRFEGVPDGRYRVLVCHFPKSDTRLYVFNGDFQRLVTASHSPPGRDAINPLPDAPTWVADVSIIVDDPRSREIVVPVQPGARISGRVVFQGRSAPPAGEALLKVPVAIRPADGGNFGLTMQATDGIPQSRVEVNGGFRTIGLPPGDYALSFSPSDVTAPPWSTWRASSIVVNGREVLGKVVTLDASDINGVIVTVTDQAAEITGSIRDAKGAPAPDARVIVFPADVEERRHYWVGSKRIVQALPDRAGGFRVTMIPGDYLVAAVTSLPRDWMTPEYLQSIAGSAVRARATTGLIANVSVTTRR
jgi:hypothetical protein